jgi:hypothetical protein
MMVPLMGQFGSFAVIAFALLGVSQCMGMNFIGNLI